VTFSEPLWPFDFILSETDDAPAAKIADSQAKYWQGLTSFSA
jgi:hypothetical protein